MTIPNISTEVQYTSTGGNGSIVFRFFLFKTFAIFLIDYKLVWKLSWLDFYYNIIKDKTIRGKLEFLQHIKN